MTTRPFLSPPTLRRIALAAAVCLLWALPLQAAPLADYGPGEYMSLAGVNADGFHKWIDEAHDKGFRIIYVNGYSAGDHAEFAGVAVKDDQNPPWEAKWGLTSEQYQQAQDDYAKKGFRPMTVSGYIGKGGAPRFAAAWVKDDNKEVQWEARHNLSEKELVETANQMRKNKLRPFKATGYVDPEGGVRFTVLYARFGESNPEWEGRHNLTADKFKEKIDDWQNNGFRPTSLSVYDTPDGPRFMAVAVKRPDIHWKWEARYGLSGKRYQAEFNTLGADGFRPIAICGYNDGGEVRYAAVWYQFK